MEGIRKKATYIVLEEEIDRDDYRKYFKTGVATKLKMIGCYRSYIDAMRRVVKLGRLTPTSYPLFYYDDYTVCRVNNTSDAVLYRERTRLRGNAGYVWRVFIGNTNLNRADIDSDKRAMHVFGKPDELYVFPNNLFSSYRILEVYETDQKE